MNEKQNQHDEQLERTKRKFSLIDAMAIITENPFDTEEQRYVKFPDSMPIWDKMKMERNALVGILSKQVFDNNFNQKIQDVLRNQSGQNIVLEAEYINSQQNFIQGFGKEHEFKLFNKMPDNDTPPIANQYIYFIQTKDSSCEAIKYINGNYQRVGEVLRIEIVLGLLFVALYSESIDDFLGTTEDPEIQAHNERYKHILKNKKYSIDTKLDTLIDGLDKNNEYVKKLVYSNLLSDAIKTLIDDQFKVQVDYLYSMEEDPNLTNKDEIIPGLEVSFDELFFKLYRTVEEIIFEPELLFQQIGTIFSQYAELDNENLQQIKDRYSKNLEKLHVLFKIEDIEELKQEAGKFLLENQNAIFTDPMVEIIRTSPNSHITAGFETGIDQINGIYFTADSIERRRYLLENPEKQLEVVDKMIALNQQKTERNLRSSLTNDTSFNKDEAATFVSTYLTYFSENVLGLLDDSQEQETKSKIDFASSPYFLFLIDAIKNMNIPVDQARVQKLVATNYHNLSKIARQHLHMLNDNGQTLTLESRYYDPNVIGVQTNRTSEQQLQINAQVFKDITTTKTASVTTFCPALPTMLIRDMFIVYQRMMSTIKGRAQNDADTGDHL